MVIDLKVSDLSIVTWAVLPGVRQVPSSLPKLLLPGIMTKSGIHPAVPVLLL